MDYYECLLPLNVFTIYMDVQVDLNLNYSLYSRFETMCTSPWRKKKY